MMAKLDDLLPENSPGTKPNVRRLSARPMFLGVGVLMLLFVLVAIGIFSKDSKKHHKPATVPSIETKDMSLHVKALFGGQGEGVVTRKEKPAQTEQTLPAIIGNNPETVITPSPQAFPTPQKTRQRKAQEERIEKLKEQFFNQKVKAFTEALNAKSTVKFKTVRDLHVSRNSGAGAALRPQNVHYQQRLLELQNRLGTNSDTNVSANFSQEGGGSSQDRWYWDKGLEKPRSKFSLRAGKIIPAIMISGINSELPGQIIAQVSQSVYDSATGKHLLIPQGTQLLGIYESQIKYGQSRVMVTWQRLNFPDDRVMDLGAMSGVDSAGYGGFTDKVNNHYFKLFGSAIMLSFITAGFEYSQDNNNNDDDNSVNASDAFSEALGQQLGMTTAKMIEKNLNISPTLEIRPGYRFNVMLNKDLVFESPYKGFDY